MLLSRLKYRLGKIIDKHPYSWFLAWKIMHKLTFLLPHDSSYFGLRHFCPILDNNLFVDVGANTGISALSFRQLNKTIPILSIEPNILHSKCLGHLKEKLNDFTFLLVGVGAKNEEVSFFTPKYKGIILHTFTACSEKQVKNAVEKSYGITISNKIEIITSSSKIIPLDQLLLKPGIIKIDAEGFDYNVLLGAKKTIEIYRPYLMIEICHSEKEQFNSFFQDFEYSMLSYCHKSDTFSNFNMDSSYQSTGNRNVFAVPKEKLSLLRLNNL